VILLKSKLGLKDYKLNFNGFYFTTDSNFIYSPQPFYILQDDINNSRLSEGFLEGKLLSLDGISDIKGIISDTTINFSGSNKNLKHYYEGEKSNGIDCLKWDYTGAIRIGDKRGGFSIKRNYK